VNVASVALQSESDVRFRIFAMSLTDGRHERVHVLVVPGETVELPASLAKHLDGGLAAFATDGSGVRMTAQHSGHECGWLFHTIGTSPPGVRFGSVN